MIRRGRLKPPTNTVRGEKRSDTRPQNRRKHANGTEKDVCARSAKTAGRQKRSTSLTMTQVEDSYTIPRSLDICWVKRTTPDRHEMSRNCLSAVPVDRTHRSEAEHQEQEPASSPRVLDFGRRPYRTDVHWLDTRLVCDLQGGCFSSAATVPQEALPDLGGPTRCSFLTRRKTTTCTSAPAMYSLA